MGYPGSGVSKVNGVSEVSGVWPERRYEAIEEACHLRALFRDFACSVGFEEPEVTRKLQLRLQFV